MAARTDAAEALDPPATPPLDDQLCFALYGASIAVGRLYKPLLDDLNLTYPQYLVLAALWERDGAAVGALAERLALEPSTVTPLAKRLEAAGFVSRTRNPVDERQVIVRLSAEGRALRHRCSCLAERMVAASGMTRADLARVNAEVRRLRDALAAASEAAAAA